MCVCVCVCVRMNSLRITYIIKYNTIFEKKMGFPANLELVFTLCWILGSNNKNFHEHMIIYNMYSKMLFLNIVRNCTHLFVKQTNKKENYFFLWPLLKIQLSLLRRLNPSGNYLLTCYTRLYTLLFGHVTCITLYINLFHLNLNDKYTVLLFSIRSC